MMTMALLLAAAVQPAAMPTLDEFFERFKASREGITVLQAEYTEKNITPDETFLAEGTLLYAQPRRILRNTHYPYQAAVLIDGTTSYQYEPDVRQLVIHELADSPEADILFFGFDSNVDRLRENYDVTLFSLPDHPLGELGLELQPKEGTEAAGLFMKALLYLRDDNLLPHRVQLVFDEESQLVVEMSDYTVNAAIAPEDSQIEIADGTAIIRNEEIVREVSGGVEYLPEPVAFDGAAPAPEADPTPEADPAEVAVTPLDEPTLETPAE